MTKEDWEFINEMLDVIKMITEKQNQKILDLEKQIKELSELKGRS